MRFQLLLLLLFVSCVLTEDHAAKAAGKKVEANKESPKKAIEEQTKSKTGKRDSADQTNSFGINANDGSFKPMLNSPTPFVAAASDTQQVYYDKNQVTVGEGAGNAKVTTNPQAANAYRAQYTQVPQQQQQQQNKNHLRVGAKNVVVQQQPQQQQHSQHHNSQPNILYAAPPNPAYHYERIPQQAQPQSQPQQQQPQLQLPAPPLPSLSSLPVQRGGQQKQIQYLIAIPMTYLRQVQQQLLHQQQQQQQQQEHNSQLLQVYKGQQQPQYSQQQVQAVPVYSVAGPLARDHQGAYRPFHRFATASNNEISTGASQTGGQAPGAAAAAAAPPGYVTQYVQIPASVLIAAMQSPHIQQQLQQLRPVPIPQQQIYQQQQPQPQSQQQQSQHAHLQPAQLQLQLQQPLVQSPAPQLYYYQPQQQQVPLKQSQPSLGLTSSPVYAYHVNPLHQQQLQQPSQQLATYQHLTEQQQQQQQQQQQHHQQQHQQVNDGKQILRVRGIRPTAIAPPTAQQQYDPSVEAYESEEKAQFVQLHAPAHLHHHQHTHSHTNAQNQHYIAQAPVARQQSPAPAQHQLVGAQAPASYEHVAHYNPQYVQSYQAQASPPRPPPHRLQIPSTAQHTPFVEHLNNLPYSQGPTPLPYFRLPADVTGGETSLHSLNMVTPQTIIPPFVSGGFQPSFAPLGMPSKVTSFTNVLLQPFVGHSPSLPATEIAAASGGTEALPFLHSSGGIRYGTHLYHPPTSAATLLNANKQLSPAAHPHARILHAPGEVKVSAVSAKSSVPPVVVGTPAIVKYP